jgi:glycosyltransferase involved in cell wall biosynthesis
MSVRRKHVLFLIPTLTGGGAERVIVTLLNHLDRANFRLTIGVVDKRDAAFLDELPADVRFLDLQASRVRFALPKLIHLIWRLKPDVVFSTLGHLNLALAGVHPILPKKTRYIARETSVVSEALQDHSAPKAWIWGYRHFFRNLDQIVCQSLDMRDDLAANFSIPVSKLTVINNPVDIERIRKLAEHPADFPFPDDPAPQGQKAIHLVTAGRLSAEKGLDILIEAIALSASKRLKVTVLGKGPLRASLEELVRCKGLEHQIRFIGFQKNPYAFMARADAFVLSSRHDAFPNAVLEALACGTPVIATPTPGGAGEIALATGGVQMASAVTAEALSVELLRFAENGRHKTATASLEQFHISKIVRDYESLFAGKQLLSEKKTELAC